MGRRGSVGSVLGRPLLALGVVDGSEDGKTEALELGEAVGAFEGSYNSEKDGSMVGFDDGNSVATELGMDEGKRLGVRLGPFELRLDGAELGGVEAFASLGLAEGVVLGTSLVEFVEKFKPKSPWLAFA
jgi:hypothetical protein